MELPRKFDGKCDLQDWVSDVDYYFEDNLSPGRFCVTWKAIVALSCLSDDVRACIQNLRAPLEEISEKEWVWTWPRLVAALSSMSIQIAHYKAEADRIRKRRIWKGVAIVGTGVLVGVGAPFAFLGILGAIGFGAGGVAAGSAAVGIQASIGAVQAGSAFALCQSTAAGGAAVVAISQASAVTAATVSTVGSAANAAAWLKIGKEMPSYSWEDGSQFKPSPDLITTLLELA